VKQEECERGEEHNACSTIDKHATWKTLKI